METDSKKGTNSVRSHVEFRCEPFERVRVVGGITCLSGQRRPTFDQLVHRMLALAPADRAAWLASHRRAMLRRPGAARYLRPRKEVAA